MEIYRNILNKVDTYKGNRYLKSIKDPSIPLRDDDIQILTDSGDRLDNLAFQFYDDTSYWIWIVLANPGKVRRDSYVVAPGTQLRIPRDLKGIIQEFENMNE